jgi:hypothetical protein
VVTVGTTVAAPTSPEAAAALDGDAVHTPDEDAHATTNPGGALEVLRPPPPEPAGVGQTDLSLVTTEAEV